MSRNNDDLEGVNPSCTLLHPPGLLTAQEEVQLAHVIAAGGEAAEQARTRFLEANQGLVQKVAWRYQGYGLDLEDLVQEGNIGLLRAIEKFDPARGFKFSTMAWWWIQQAITREILNTGRTIRLPVHFQEALRRMNKVEVRLAAELDRLPTGEELAEATGYTIARIEELRGTPWTVSLDEPLADEDLSREDTIADPAASCEETVIADMQAEQLDRLLAATLTPRVLFSSISTARLTRHRSRASKRCPRREGRNERASRSEVDVGSPLSCKYGMTSISGVQERKMNG